MKRTVFLPEAEQEMLEAAEYYEAQAPGLGGEYLAEVDRAIGSVSSNPEAWPAIEGGLHRRLVRRFPVAVLYTIGQEEIIIVALAHLRKKPGYWKQRLSK